ncbi:hypothetical protein [Arthrobacter pityocampae]|uniref:hypothetical protein n=1 Tax=Arthrobacter pityocampae TaxID=547334 RepID=UPI0037362441
MPWFKVDDGFHGHPKVLALSAADVGVWTLAGTWCAQYLTDGQIAMSAITRLGGTAKNCKALVAAGMWIDNQDGTYQFKDWDDYQPMKSDVEAERDAARERMRKVRSKRTGTSGERSEPVRANTEGTSEEVRVTPTQPVPTRTEAKASVTPQKRGSRIPEDFAPTEAMVAWAKENTPDVNGRISTQKFINYWTAKTGKDATKLDWAATWRNWMLSDQEKAAPRDGGMTTSERRIATNLRALDSYEPTPFKNPFEQKAIRA